MVCKEVMELLQKHSPEGYACEWDNVGLLVGNREKEIHHIYVALDATDQVICDAVECKADLLLTHHPMIFRGLKKIDAEDFIGRRIIRLIQNDISYYAMHTNFDVVGMADMAAEYMGLTKAQALQVTQAGPEGGMALGIGKVGNLPGMLDFKSCVERVKQAFQVSVVKVYGAGRDSDFLKKQVRRVAICPGSGKSVIGDAIKAGAQVLITGDIDHHEGIDAVARGLAIIDAGHYGLEKMFVPYMKQYLKEHIAKIKVTEEKCKDPFAY